jgi:L-malate glycosyltransferase
MLRICHLISGDLWAGAEVMAYNLLKGLSRLKDVDLSAIIFNDGKLATAVRNLGITVDVVEEDKFSFLPAVKATKKIIQGKQVHILHTHRYKENILGYLASCGMKNVSLISTQHGMPSKSWNHNPRYAATQKINFYFLSKFFKLTVAVSKDIKDNLVREYGFPKEKIEVIHNGIQMPGNIICDSRKDSFTIGSAGRLFPEKDYALFVNLANAVVKIKPGIRFLLAGEGPERGNIQNLVRDSGLEESFTFLGFVNDMSAFYRRLNLYVNTSLHEGIPMSVLEAMAHGLPVIAPDVGGFHEIIEEGAQGYLVRERDPEEFADRILRLYENHELRNQMSLAAREKVAREFTHERIAGEYFQLYKKIDSKDEEIPK